MRWDRAKRQQAQPAKIQKPLTIDQTSLETWFERDRAHVELRNKLDDSTIVEWWDEAVSEAIEDGFLNPRDYHTSAYGYAQCQNMLPSRVHYIAGSGMHGRLYDSCNIYETYTEAVNGLAELFELGRTRKAHLRKHGYLELTPSPIEKRQGVEFGADYCEITECDCERPEQHQD